MRSISLAAIAAVLALTGCATTDDEPESATPPPTATISAQQAAKQARKNKRRSQQIIADYKSFGGKGAWLIKSVKVDGHDVTVRTNLYPKSDNRPAFIGACTTLVHLYPWIQTVTVEGGDGWGHASWYKGNPGCQTQGI